MAKFEGPHNQSIPGQLKNLVRVYWSQARSWHGTELTVSVRAENAKEGAEVVLGIVASADQSEVDTVKGQKLTGGKLDHKYKLEWKGTGSIKSS
jgi:hypothetical protein